MTTTLVPPESAATDHHVLRILPIAANLLPAEIVELRRGRKVRRSVLSALLAFALVLGGWYGLARYQTSTARDSLTAAENDAQLVQHQQRDFAEVVSVQADSLAIRTQLSTLLAQDLRWSRLLASLQAVAPEGVYVTGVTGSLTDAAAEAGKTASLPDTSGAKKVGTLLVIGTGTSHVALAAYLEVLAKTPGLGNPVLGGVLAQDGGRQFTLELDITSSALGGRYTPAGNGSGAR